MKTWFLWVLWYPQQIFYNNKSLPFFTTATKKYTEKYVLPLSTFQYVALTQMVRNQPD